MSSVEQPIAAKVDALDSTIEIIEAVDLRHDAALATEAEHNLSMWRAVHEHKKAVFWSLFIGLSAIMWGYDAQISGGLLSSPEFRKDFGHIYHGSPVLPARWQSAFNSASSVGGFLGCLVTGWTADRYGRKTALAIACVNSIGAIFVQFFSSKLKAVLLLGKFLNGLSLGGFLTISPAYCAEVNPVTLRGPTTSGVNLFIAFGQLLANGLIKATGARDDSYAYRIPFAIQWIFPVLLLCGLKFCPESPWWLIGKGRDERAAESLGRLGYKDIKISMANIKETVRIERHLQAGATYRECFRGTDRRRTEIGMGSFTVQQLVGCVFVIGYSSYFFQLAGFPTSQSFSLGMGVSTLGIVGNIVSWFLVNSVGRRPSFLVGVAALFTILMLLGILDVVPDHNRGNRWGQAIMCVVFNFTYFLTVGPMSWTLFAEISSARLRSRAVGLGIVVQSVLSMIVNIIVPYLINPDEANLKGKVGFVFAGLTAACFGWVYYRVPETKNRTFEELDIMFANGIPARQFASYRVDHSETSLRSRKKDKV